MEKGFLLNLLYLGHIMKLFIHFLFLVFSSFPIACQAQTWVQHDATWHYDFWNVASGGFYKLSYSEDTLIGGTLCQRIDTKKYTFISDQFGTIQLQDSSQFAPQYTYTNGDTVFYWNDNQFFTLFNFGANIGDQWLIGTSNPQAFGVCSDSSFVEVIDAGSVTIHSTNYRTITLATVDSSAIGLSGVFVERFGFLDSNQAFLPFPRTMNCNGDVIEYDILTFKCFEDDSLSLYNPSGEDCEYYLTHLDLEELPKNNVTVHPNPFREWINISTSTSGEFTLYDVKGTELEHHSFSEGTNIKLSHLKHGLYLLIYKDESGVMQRTRILKTGAK